ncbi:MAG: RnfABCDGE type electron transport complex subunit B [Bacteroidetes bacterium]|nr:RnfABCDGE type electron transport complex subunit B [Bacteroidota bacterium]MBU1719557.1 RnfABCDGE type electron transport complex subunit B [Bacteroidota bacterium]
MNEVVVYSVISLGAIGAIAAIVLFFVAQKFKVIEDPRLDLVEAELPGANCGGCGFPSCRNFADAVVKTQDLRNLDCPVGGNAVMAKVAPIIGIEASEKDPLIAVVRCNGSKTYAPAKVVFDGPKTCTFAHLLHAGESGCPSGCVGLGDCVSACKFDAICIDEASGLPVVSNEKCVACGACVKACPRSIIEIRKKGKKDRRIFVSCINTEKGAPAKKNCAVACIGCGKCVKICPHDAIVLEKNLAYIDFDKCILCRKCAPECPTGSILELNFPLRKEKTSVNDEKVHTSASEKPLNSINESNQQE